MKTSQELMPKARKLLAELGERIKLARLRRRLSSEQVAERAGISRSTLWQVEKGAATPSMGTYFMVLFTLGLEKDFQKLAQDDELGRKLQDAALIPKERAPKKKTQNNVGGK
jgi:transcriptional regulator with XRE-family HTH domain